MIKDEGLVLNVTVNIRAGKHLLLPESILEMNCASKYSSEVEVERRGDVLWKCLLVWQ